MHPQPWPSSERRNIHKVFAKRPFYTFQFQQLWWKYCWHPFLYRPRLSSTKVNVSGILTSLVIGQVIKRHLIQSLLLPALPWRGKEALALHKIQWNGQIIYFPGHSHHCHYQTPRHGFSDLHSWSQLSSFRNDIYSGKTWAQKSNLSKLFPWRKPGVNSVNRRIVAAPPRVTNHNALWKKLFLAQISWLVGSEGEGNYQIIFQSSFSIVIINTTSWISRSTFVIPII